MDHMHISGNGIESIILFLPYGSMGQKKKNFKIKR